MIEGYMLVPEELQGTAEEGEEGCHGPGRHFLILKEGGEEKWVWLLAAHLSRRWCLSSPDGFP